MPYTQVHQLSTFATIISFFLKYSGVPFAFGLGSYIIFNFHEFLVCFYLERLLKSKDIVTFLRDSGVFSVYHF